MTRVRSVLLTITAIAGSLCLLVALAGLVAGVKPLVFRSGSMNPTIPAGALGFSSPVAAEDLRAGDVVSVVSSTGRRVTHRVVAVDGSGPVRALTLQGDANPVPDTETYRVDRVDRIFWSVPGLGYVIAFLGGRIGLLLLGGFVVAMLMVVFRLPGRPRGGKRRATGVAAATVATAVVVTTSGGTAAAFSDTAVVAGAFAARTSASPAAIAAPGNCSATNVVLASFITLKWSGVTPGAQPAPQLANYEYQLTFLDRDRGNAVLGSKTVPHVNGAGELQTYQLSQDLLGSLLGLNLLSSNHVTTVIRAHLIGTSWYGTTSVSINWTETTILGIATFTCNT